MSYITLISYVKMYLIILGKKSLDRTHRRWADCAITFNTSNSRSTWGKFIGCATHTLPRQLNFILKSPPLTYPSIHPSTYIRDTHIMVVAKVDRPQNIQTLIDSVERYNPENVPVLEDYLSQQCSNDTYDLEANLALLKLYADWESYTPICPILTRPISFQIPIQPL